MHEIPSECLLEIFQLQGHFVRISYDEVSISHPDAIAKILVAPLHKVPFFLLLPKPKPYYFPFSTPRHHLTCFIPRPRRTGTKFTPYPTTGSNHQ